MPVREDGKWESWETRTAREKAEADEEVAMSISVDDGKVIFEDLPKARRQRRSRKAAEAAIAEATGAAVDLTETEDAETGEEDENEPE